jgi:hypothetical protein
MSLNPEKAPRQRGLVLLNKAERLLLDLSPALDKIPRHQRYRFGLRLENALWGLIETIIRAVCSGQKSKVHRVDEQIRLLHALFRHGAERKLIKLKSVGDASRQLTEIGAMVGAWQKKLN